jgi:uncharacterized membrane protein
MIEFGNQVVVEQPVDEVFGFVPDCRNLPKWNYYVVDVSKTSDGPLGKWTIFHQVRRTDEQDYRIVMYQPNRRVTIRTVPPSNPEFEMRFTLESEGSGTRITDECKLDTARPALLERLGAGQIRLAVQENLAELKAVLKTGQVRRQDGRQVALWSGIHERNEGHTPYAT